MNIIARRLAQNLYQQLCIKSGVPSFFFTRIKILLLNFDSLSEPPEVSFSLNGIYRTSGGYSHTPRPAAKTIKRRGRRTFAQLIAARPGWSRTQTYGGPEGPFPSGNERKRMRSAAFCCATMSGHGRDSSAFSGEERHQADGRILWLSALKNGTS